MKRYMVVIQWCGILFSHCAYSSEGLKTPLLPYLRRVRTTYGELSKASQPSDSDIKEAAGCPIDRNYFDNIRNDFVSCLDDFQNLKRPQALKELPDRIKDVRSRCQKYLSEGAQRGFQDDSVKSSLEECDQKLIALLTNIMHPSTLFETSQQPIEVDKNLVTIHSNKSSPTLKSPSSANRRERCQSPLPSSRFLAKSVAVAKASRDSASPSSPPSPQLGTLSHAPRQPRRALSESSVIRRGNS